MKHRLRTSLTASALTVLLVSCGGGSSSDNNSNVSSSPQTQGTQTAASAQGTTADTANTTVPDMSGGTAANSGSDAPVTDVSTAAPDAPGNTTAAELLEPVGQPDSGGAPVAPTQPANSTPYPAPARSVPTVSSSGVRGDVLLAMIEQRNCGSWTRQSASYDGYALTSWDTPDVRFYAELEGANNYTRDPNDSHYLDGKGGRECWREFYKPVTNGTYNYKIRTENYYLRYRERAMIGEPWLKRGFHDLSIGYTITVNENQFQIGPSIGVLSIEDRGYLMKYEDWNGENHKGARDNPYFVPTPARDFNRSEEVPFGILREWDERWMGVPFPSTEKHFARLMLVKSDVPNQAKLCSNIEVMYAKRMICTVWNIPPTWNWGQELEYVDAYIIDDRSTYPNDSGFLYWRNRPTYNQ